MNYYLRIFLMLGLVSCFWGCEDDPEPDTTAPGEVSDFIVITGDKQITLSWSAPGDEDLAGFELTVAPGNMTQSFDADASSFTVTGLDNGTEYTFTLKSRDQVGNLSTGVSITGTPSSSDLPPTNATNFAAQPDNAKIILSWTKPADPDLTGYELSYAPGGNTIEIAATEETYTISGLTNETEYTFTLVSIDATNQKSDGISITATPTIDAVAPGDVTGLAATEGDEKITLSWTNPSDVDLAGLEITYIPEDSVIIIDEVLDTYTISGLSNGTAYTFTVKAKDAVGNLSTGISVSATPADQPPLDASDLSYTGNFDNKTITITWVKPSDDDLAGYELVYTDWNFSVGRVLPATDLIDGSGSMTLDANAESATFTAINDHVFIIELKAKDAAGNLSNGVGTTVYFGGVSFNHNLSTANGGSDFSLEEFWNPDITHVLGGKLRLQNGVFDLSPLSKLQVVEGDLEIRNNNGTVGTVNTKLASLAGLENLIQINRMEVDGHDDLNDVADFCALLKLVQTGARETGTEGSGYWWDGIDDNSNGWEPQGNAFNPTPGDILNNCQ